MSFIFKIYIPTIDILLFRIAHIRILRSMKCGKTRNDYFNKMQKNEVKEILCKKTAKNWYINTKSTLGWKQAIINVSNWC